jgi:hypothetical protein
LRLTRTSSTPSPPTRAPHGGWQGIYGNVTLGAFMGFMTAALLAFQPMKALASIPDHLRSAALACGATPWQTTARVVSPLKETRRYSVTKNGDLTDGSQAAGAVRFAVPLIFTVLFLMSVLMTSGYLMQGTATEKENKVVDVLLASAGPDEILAGKLLGLGGAGLLQIAVWNNLSIRLIDHKIAVHEGYLGDLVAILRFYVTLPQVLGFMHVSVGVNDFHSFPHTTPPWDDKDAANSSSMVEKSSKCPNRNACLLAANSHSGVSDQIASPNCPKVFCALILPGSVAHPDPAGP